MENRSLRPTGRNSASTNYWLAGLTVGFLGLGASFLVNAGGHPVPRQDIPLVDPKFLETTPWRQTYADFVKAKAEAKDDKARSKANDDLADYDCYGCHEKNKPPPIRYDANQKIIVPKEHSDIVMGHGSHDRNNLCYNCHNEQNLLTLQVRNGNEVKFDNIPPLCGSCHGPTYRDWEAGAHGRISGFWDRSKGDMSRLVCANCHNPHAPKIPSREPAPGPHALRATKETPESAEASH